MSSTPRSSTPRSSTPRSAAPHSAPTRPATRPHGGPLQRAVVAVSAACARRPRLTILAWLLAVTALVTLGALTGTRVLTDADAGTGPSQRADARLAAAGLAAPPGEVILIRSPHAHRTSAVAAELTRRLTGLPGVAAVRSPSPAQPGGLTADAARTQLVQVTLRGTLDDAPSTVGPVRAAVASVAAASPDVHVAQTGDGSAGRAVDDVLTQDLHRAELVSLPLTLVVLLLVFGSLVAAAVPLLFGVTTVAAALGALGVLSQVMPVSGSASTLLVLIGLAVGVDYSLFILRRERAERRAGRAPQAALAAAVAATSRAIVVAGATVAIALAGLALTGMAMFTSMALGTVIVVVIAVVGSVTVLPATLSLLGDRAGAGRLRRPGARRRGAGERAAGSRAGRTRSGWGSVAGAVTRHPGAALVSALAVLGAVASPALGLRLGAPGLDDMPSRVPVVAASHEITRAFPTSSSTAQLVVEGSHLGNAASRRALRALGERAAGRVPGSGPLDVRVSHDQRTAVIEVPVPSDGGATGVAGAARAATDVAALRAATAHVGASGGALSADRVLVTGDAAWNVDFSDRLAARTPLVVGVVLALALVLLVLSFGSLPLALAVSALNLLSVAAAYGILTAVFQHAWAARALGFTPTGAVVQWVPLFAFVILFGLSMDYTVLVLERIREARAHGHDPRSAATLGVAATGGTVSAAAVVMVTVFALFAGLRLVEFKEIGIGLGVAVALDATLVRGVALPAVVTLLGHRGWRVARPADALGGEPGGAPVPAAAAPTMSR